MVVLSKVTGDHIPVLNNSIEVIQVQQNTILQLRAAEQAATDEAAKARIKEELAKATDVLTKNAEFMGKTYGVVTNNLVFDVLEAHFWVALTPDELKAYVAQNHGTAAQALAEATDAPKLDVKKDKKSS
jgi:ribosomal protein L9